MLKTLYNSKNKLNTFNNLKFIYNKEICILIIFLQNYSHKKYIL